MLTRENERKTTKKMMVGRKLSKQKSLIQVNKKIKINY